VAIAGNVTTCDDCGRQLSMPMEPDGSKESLDERVRSFAVEVGWRHTDHGDFCPDHMLEANPGTTHA
jgi:hypothetical protein